jgi:nitroimidazol reductase NimA-like FMN-containing flavoprotein (pyridoxamine 5'-phosphate oxidase superfamily)
MLQVRAATVATLAARPDSRDAFPARGSPELPEADMRTPSSTSSRHQHAPVIRDLAPDECAAVLARGHVGRLAFSHRDRVDIQPVHYVYDDGWLYGRTSEGAKMVALRHNPWVAFEVDEVHSPADWTSVVVKGSFHRLDGNEAPRERLAREHAVELLRALVPGTLKPDDPTPWRGVVFRIAVDQITGREARPAT